MSTISLPDTTPDISLTGLLLRHYIAKLSWQYLMTTVPLDVLDPYGDLLYFTVSAFWDHHFMLSGFCFGSTPQYLELTYVPLQTDIAARLRGVRELLDCVDQAFAWPKRHLMSHRMFGCTYTLESLPQEHTPLSSKAQEMRCHHRQITEVTCSTTSSTPTDGPGGSYRSSSSGFTSSKQAGNFPATAAGSSSRPHSSVSKRHRGGDNDPPDQPGHLKKGPLPGPSRRRKKGHVRCPWAHSTDGQHETVCRQPRLYVARLKIHLQKHRFYYCLTCMSTFDNEEQRHTHKAGCDFKCIMPECTNRNSFPRYTGRPCNHKRNQNSQRMLYQELCRMAQRKMSLTFLRDTLPDVEMLDVEEATMDDGDEDEHSADDEGVKIETPSEDIEDVEDVRTATTAHPQTANYALMPATQTRHTSSNITLPARLREFADTIDAFNARYTDRRETLDETTRLAIEVVEFALNQGQRQVSTRLYHTTPRSEWSARSNASRSHLSSVPATSMTTTQTEATPVDTSITLPNYSQGLQPPDNGNSLPPGLFGGPSAAATVDDDIALTGSAFPPTPLDTQGQVRYPQEVSPFVADGLHAPEEIADDHGNF